MRVVGLTGGFGSGKSFVASVFKSLGAAIVDADRLGHRALRKGTAVYNRVVAAFGERILNSNLSINRRALAGIVFDDKRKLAKLNSIVHPEIIRNIKDGIRKAAKDEILIIDAPLICEAGLTDLVDLLIVVKASKARRIRRSSRKFGICEEDAFKRMACQMPLSEKVRAADYLINNDGTKEETKKQVREIWLELKKGA